MYHQVIMTNYPILNSSITDILTYFKKECLISSHTDGDFEHA